ncbi:hypothetical protein BDZ45DRAFT_72354 [Acephala macrosclerotiorum]|nr:hypothetical protein BDZ45DRAFT_72354 [Acephala macrosclerotiorum]
MPFLPPPSQPSSQPARTKKLPNQPGTPSCSYPSSRLVQVAAFPTPPPSLTQGRSLPCLASPGVCYLLAVHHRAAKLFDLCSATRTGSRVDWGSHIQDHPPQLSSAH